MAGPRRDPDLIGLFVEPLEATGITYMITGGVASVIYGDPRRLTGELRSPGAWRGDPKGV